MLFSFFFLLLYLFVLVDVFSWKVVGELFCMICRSFFIHFFGCDCREFGTLVFLSDVLEAILLLVKDMVHKTCCSSLRHVLEVSFLVYLVSDLRICSSDCVPFASEWSDPAFFLIAICSRTVISLSRVGAFLGFILRMLHSWSCFVVYGIKPVSVLAMSAEKVILFSQDEGKSSIMEL